MNVDALIQAKEELIKESVYTHEQMVAKAIEQDWSSDAELRKAAEWQRVQLQKKLREAEAEEGNAKDDEEDQEYYSAKISDLEEQLEKVHAVIRYGVAPHVQEWRFAFQEDLHRTETICRKHGVKCQL